MLKQYDNFTFYKASLEDNEAINKIFAEHKFDAVINLAAQAGVRYSLENPMAYIDSNIVGFVNILEACRHNEISHLIYASSSSVYGSNTKIPFSVHDNIDHQCLYAATRNLMSLWLIYSHCLDYLQLGYVSLQYGPWEDLIWLCSYLLINS